MSWPTRRPDYLPAAAWDHAHVLRAQAGADPQVLARLIAPGMRPTWLRLTRCGVSDPTGWRLILESFHACRDGAGWDRDARGALRRARALMPDIIEAADHLRDLLEEARELGDRHALRLPIEFRDIDDRDPVELLGSLALAAEEHDPAPAHPDAAHATTTKAGPGADWARAFDTRWRLYTAPLVPLARLTPADVARIGSAVLGYAISRETVAKALRDAPGPLPSDRVVLFRR